MKFGPIAQFGYLADNLDKTVQLWVNLGVGPLSNIDWSGNIIWHEMT